jgi:hypothetical protein
MHSAKSHVSTRLVADVPITLVFFPDTGCLRITDATGICEEWRPPHTWRALASAWPGWRSHARALDDELRALLDAFCRERSAFLAAREQARRDGNVTRSRNDGHPTGQPSPATVLAAITASRNAERLRTGQAQTAGANAVVPVAPSFPAGTVAPVAAAAPVATIVQPASIAPANDEPLCA